MLTPAQITQILIAFLLSLFTAWVTVRLSLSQFRSERWWEKKAEAYSNIIEHLSRLEYQLWLWRDGIQAKPPITAKQEDRIAESAKISLDEIMKASSIGAFLISDEAASILMGLRAEIEQLAARPFDPDAEIQAISSFQEMLKAAISRIRAYAKVDLKSK